jgi:cytochrome c-type biogenesis protein CcmE
MSPAQKKRGIIVLSIVAGISVAIILTLFALSKNINLFYTPSQLAQEKISQQRPIRIGGMVVKNSVIRNQDLAVEFVITDFNQQIKVKYAGILPDLFKEGQGVVAQGVLNADGSFKATQVLAKHDEKYMPPEIADLKRERR